MITPPLTLTLSPERRGGGDLFRGSLAYTERWQAAALHRCKCYYLDYDYAPHHNGLRKTLTYVHDT